MSKVCECCGVEKPHSSFSFRKDNGKYRPVCKPCRSSETAARRYGISVGDVESLAEQQGHRCAICGTHKDAIPHGSFKHNPLVIDHEHGTGRIRGLLCPTCNMGLGHFKDSPRLLAAALQYLT